MRLWGSIGFILTVVALGRLFEWLSLDIYPVALVAIMAGIVLASLWVPNAQPPGPARAQRWWRLSQATGQPWRGRVLRVRALMQLSHGPYYTFLTLHLERLGYARGTIGMLWALGVVAEVLMFLAMSWILARFSLRRVLLASLLLAALRWWLLGTFAEYPGVLLFAQLLHAATFGSFHAAAIAFVQRSFGARQQGPGAGAVCGPGRYWRCAGCPVFGLQLERPGRHHHL